jgi:ATP-dependent Clp protease adaptor protein ClpS
MRGMFARSQIVPGTSRRPKERDRQGHPCRVFVHNDDVTPMDFVVHILKTIFLIPTPNAEHIMYTAHLNGKAYVQTLPVQEARRRIGKALFSARLQHLPLEFSLEDN